MTGEIIDQIQQLEIRGDLTPEQRNVCLQLVNAIQGVTGVEFEAMGMAPNMVVVGGEPSPCVWFRIKGNPRQYQITAAINTFKKTPVGVVSDCKFTDKGPRESIPFGPTLGKYVLPNVKIDLPNTK